ncbi:hypothetical protein [Meiothermus sp. CFH 77666]|uniref:hypothetical protein n=1 Tax=Meiothermus sp. CFH 77666 TaxID=2817942 RepID=UPI001AA07B66|nr:hypothetical protein [Meiothermus sp. CFH 77666]MBO1436106.1 hypothetical protein [Meiothermus sp. CFH 77666]
MDYLIRRRTSELESTGYMEIGPGRYTGKHWQDSFIFVWEDAFGMAEGIIAKHLPTYNHFAVNEVPREVGQRIVDEWKGVASALGVVRPDEASRLLHLDLSYGMDMEKEISEHREAISTMLVGLATACTSFYESEDWICILGM